MTRLIAVLAVLSATWIFPTCANVDQWRSSPAFVAWRPSRRNKKLDLRTRTTTRRYASKQQALASSSDTRPLRGLYNRLEPYNEGNLKVDALHTLAYKEYGNQDGLPALFLHGGPGAGCTSNHARFFNPDLYRIVLFDQRGCGSSTPKGETCNNTLLQLVEDCERLRKRLDVGEQWKVVLGGSWGSTLGLAYAQEYPHSVGSLVLRGVCLMRQAEVDWLFTSHGVAEQLPESWKAFDDAFSDDNGAPRSSSHGALFGHYDRLMQTHLPKVRLSAAQSWMMWEMAVTGAARSQNGTERAPVLVGRGNYWWVQNSDGEKVEPDDDESFAVGLYLDGMKRGLSDAACESQRKVEAPRKPNPLPPPENEAPINLPPYMSKTNLTQFIPAQAILTCFYSVNNQYAMDNLCLLDRRRIERVSDIPCIAVHGGQDPICPLDNALLLQKAWTEMELRIPTESGHSMYDDSITHELVEATDRFAEYWQNECQS